MQGNTCWRTEPVDEENLNSMEMLTTEGDSPVKVMLNKNLE